MARLVLKSQGGGGAMVPRSTPVGEVPPPLSVFYTGLIGRRRGRWKFSSPWHRKKPPYSRFFLVAITILGVDLIPGCARNGGSPPRAPGARGGDARVFFYDENFEGHNFFINFHVRKGRGPENAKNPKSENVTKTRFSRFFKGPGATIFL